MATSNSATVHVTDASFAGEIEQTVAAYRRLFAARATRPFEVDPWAERAWATISELAEPMTDAAHPGRPLLEDVGHRREPHRLGELAAGAGEGFGSEVGRGHPLDGVVTAAEAAVAAAAAETGTRH